MKTPTAMRHVTTAGNLDVSGATRMEIDADGMIVVMSLLSNLYSNGSEAVVREYACNARDSHVEAGQTKPIEVTLPTMLNPQFQVQDWGVGLSRDEIFNVYARYGASTKRNSNDQIGAFGIGAKSAFTVGNQFTVSSVKNGEKTIVMFSLQRQGTPMVQELYHGTTDEPNGVLVDVGVENVNAVNAAAEKIFTCWKEGTVLVDGKSPVSMWKGTEKLADEVYVDWESPVVYNMPHFKLVMGGVPYTIPHALWPELSPKAQRFHDDAKRTSITYILDVPIGRVDITPNREELHITPRTRSTVGRLVELAANSLQGWITKKLDSAPTIWEAAKTYTQLSTKLNYQADPNLVYWKGQKLGDQFVTLDSDVYTLDRRGYMANGAPADYRTVHSTGYSASITKSAYNDIMFVVGVPEDKINIVRTYSKLMLLDQGKKNIVAIRPKSYRQDWFSVGDGADHTDIAYMHFQDFWTKGKALRKAQPGGSSRSKTRYTTWSTGDTTRHMRNVEDIAELDTKIVALGYFNPNNPVEIAFLKANDITVVQLNSRQSEEVFKRSFSEAKAYHDLLKPFAENLVANLLAKDVAILKASSMQDSVNHESMKFVTAWSHLITNKAVIDYVNNTKNQMSLSNQDQDRLTFLEHLYRTANKPNPYASGTTDDFFRSKLPLLPAVLANKWGAQRVLGTHDIVVHSLTDYINNTNVV